MRLHYVVPVLALFVVAIVMSGCSGVKTDQSTTPEPPPGIPTPAATTGPDSIGTIHSTQVRLTGLDVSFARTDRYQAENLSITLENIGSTEVRNVGFYLKERDLQNGVFLYSKLYLLDRPIPAHGNYTFELTSGSHEDYAYSIIVDWRAYWGDNLEYYNEGKVTRSLPVIP